MFDQKSLVDACEKAGYTVKKESKTRWVASHPGCEECIVWDVQEDDGSVVSVCVCKPIKPPKNAKPSKNAK